MDAATVRSMLEQHFDNASSDPDLAHAMYHEDAVLEFPQSGERFEGVENFRDWRSSYPAGTTFVESGALVTRNFLVTAETLVFPAMATKGKSRRPKAGSEECVRGDAALARAFDFLGKRWNGMILGALSEGPVGFRELSRSIGAISDSVLSDRLSALAGAGLISRTVDEGPPLAVSYRLTDRGQALIPALSQISLWAQEHLVHD
jgi:DNA-binding HxlR family transcriptional regulator